MELVFHWKTSIWGSLGGDLVTSGSILQGLGDMLESFGAAGGHDGDSGGLDAHLGAS